MEEPQQQEVTMEGMVINDLAQQIAAISVDRAAWRARATAAEQQLGIASEEIAEEKEEDK